MQIVRVGLDLAKYVFEIHGVDAQEKVVLRKTVRRDALAAFFADLLPCLVGMEACSGAHYWARVLSDLGHQVRLISPQFVTPYVKSKRTAASSPHRAGRAPVARRSVSSHGRDRAAGRRGCWGSPSEATATSAR